jgi:hypothetical protein
MTDGAAMQTIDAAISNANPRRMPPSATSPVLRCIGFPGRFGFLFNAGSCQAFGHFIVVSSKGDIVFP